MFAISATAADADRTYRRMLDAVAKIIEEYGTEKLQYGVIIYGRTAVVRRKLGDSFPDDKSLKLFIRDSPRETGGSVLENALKQAKNMFNPQNGARADADKVLVVITDSKATGSDSAVTAAAKELRDEGVKVIAVVLGSQSDPKITNVKDDVIRERKDQSSSVVANKIMDRVKGKFSSDVV